MNGCTEDCFQDIGNGYVKASLGPKKGIIKASSIDRVEMRDLLVTLYNSASDIIVVFETTSVQSACAMLDHIGCILTGRKAPIVFSPELKKLLKTNIFVFIDSIRVEGRRFFVQKVASQMREKKIRTVQDYIGYGARQWQRYGCIGPTACELIKAALLAHDPVFESFGILNDESFCELLGLSFKPDLKSLEEDNE